MFPAPALPCRTANDPIRSGAVHAPAADDGDGADDVTVCVTVCVTVTVCVSTCVFVFVKPQPATANAATAARTSFMRFSSTSVGRRLPVVPGDEDRDGGHDHRDHVRNDDRDVAQAD